MDSEKENTLDQKEEKRSVGISRRNFFKASGIAAGVAALGLVTKSQPVYAGQESESAIVNFAVQEVDQSPYNLPPFANAENLKRYELGKNAFYSKELSMDKFGGNPWHIEAEKYIVKFIKEGVPGYSLMDNAFYDAAWASYKGTPLFSWEPLGVSNIKRAETVGKWEATPEQNNRYIKKVANEYGSGDTGVAVLNEQWFLSQDEKGKPYVFSTEHSKPTITEEAYYIPKTMNRVIVMLAPMNPNMLKYAPTTLSEATVGTEYSQMAESAGKMAEFIRGLGYNAIPMGNDASLSVPIAIDAGLGELGRHGLLVHPEYGSSVRISKVLTDLPIAPDKPISFGAAEFCRTCMKCAEACPSESISKDKDPSDKVACASNNPGMKKWYVNTWTCLNQWVENGGGCNICLSACPYNKPKTWIHDVVKGVSAKTTVFNSTFATLDDALGYGTHDKNPKEFWDSDKNVPKWW
ncbi:reductive dehalogenase [Desulfitobacterium dehalogenans ATCC 51507]|uniref:Reductive dehalogenase n=1 Tax=Desulfitobacterium dehalogenans (strain ATCC 51507 / DSM 9161 / JW/IU-DC1) TaxID=756499 RepID=I4A3K2_DESDJ|nr:reductive dehalogenase [Desulfitobacterium dehalogenans]AFL98536.1 reductive dehalogenase [Desulfitobacterium dehalogenans ATCC 51507]